MDISGVKEYITLPSTATIQEMIFNSALSPRCNISGQKLPQHASLACSIHLSLTEKAGCSHVFQKEKGAENLRLTPGGTAAALSEQLLLPPTLTPITASQLAEGDAQSRPPGFPIRVSRVRGQTAGADGHLQGQCSGCAQSRKAPCVASLRARRQPCR